MVRRVSLSLSVLWDLAAEYRGGRTSTVICFFPFSHCVLGPYGGMWRRRLTPDSLMALPDVGTKVMETKREGSGVFLVTLSVFPFRPIIPAPTAVIPPSRYGVAFYIPTSPSPAILSAAPPLSDPHLGPWRPALPSLPLRRSRRQSRRDRGVEIGIFWSPFQPSRFLQLFTLPLR